MSDKIVNSAIALRNHVNPEVRDLANDCIELVNTIHSTMRLLKRCMRDDPLLAEVQTAYAQLRSLVGPEL